MNIQAYCDECFTHVEVEYATSKKPCPKCGNTFYFVPGDMREDGSIPLLSQREVNLREYYDALEEVWAIRIRSMTAESYSRYVAAGERNIAALEAAFDEMVALDKRQGLEPLLPDSIPMPIKLPDMYMRHGRWEDAQRIYDFCARIPYLADFDFQRLKAECEENRRCAAEIEALVANGTTSQKAIRKALADRYSSRPINFLLGYFQRFKRVKSGSDSIVSLTPEEQLF